MITQAHHSSCEQVYCSFDIMSREMDSIVSLDINESPNSLISSDQILMKTHKVYYSDPLLGTYSKLLIKSWCLVLDILCRSIFLDRRDKSIHHCCSILRSLPHSLFLSRKNRTFSCIHKSLC